MDKFVFVADSHFQGKRIETRTDDYCKSLFEKLDFVIDFCRKHNVGNLIHGGDLLNNPNISDLVAGRIAKALSKSKLQVWYTIGNHDITGKNPETYVNGKLHMFESYDWFHFIGGKLCEFENCVLMGVDYDYENEDRTGYVMEQFCGIEKTKILVLHAMIYGGEKDLMVNKKRIVASYRQIDTNADLVLCGHYHPGMKVKKLTVLNKDIMFANPGSFGRTDKLTNRVGIGPGLTYVCIGKKGIVKLKNIKIPCDRNVFIDTDEGKYQLADVSSAKFYESLHKLKEYQSVKNDIGLMLKAMSAIENSSIPFEIDDEIIEFIIRKVREVEGGHSKDK